MQDYPNPLSAFRHSHTNNPEYERMENGEEIDVSTAPEFEAYRRLDREIVEAGYPNWQERQYRLVRSSDAPPPLVFSVEPSVAAHNVHRACSSTSA